MRFQRLIIVFLTTIGLFSSTSGAAFSQGRMAGGLSITICSPNGTHEIIIGANGEPVPAEHECENCCFIALDAHIAPGYFIPPVRLGLDGVWRLLFQLDVIYTVALDTVNMVMGFHIPVKTFLAAAYFNFSDNPVQGKYFQVSIDRGQADAREFFLYSLVELVRRRMPGRFSQFLQDDFPLMGHA
ncbi:MAG: hypothetical protein L3J05_08645 [Robiginitomaculum sp.]|nr:hypothetical protein [Robiginitomaculum sp.]